MSINTGYFTVTGFVTPYIAEPAVGDVRAGTQYGALGTEFTGTLNTAAADYPAVSNVLSGVSYDFGGMVGTLTLPAASDVRSGVTYGPGGTGYNGTLVIPAAPVLVSGSGSSGFLGRDSVEADLSLHRDMAGGVTTATLAKKGGGTLALNNVCLWPDRQRSALGGGGFPARTAQATFWRTGEADFPKPDDVMTVHGVKYTVAALDGKRLFADEASGYAVYDYTLTRAF